MNNEITTKSENSSMAVVEKSLDKKLSGQEYRIRVWEGSHVRVATKKLHARLTKMELIALADLILDIANATEHETKLSIS